MRTDAELYSDLWNKERAERIARRQERAAHQRRGMQTELGHRYRDVITGLEGYATGKCEYISGCAQTLIVAPAAVGKMGDSQWFDDQRLQPIGGAVIKLDNGAAPGCDRPAPIR